MTKRAILVAQMLVLLSSVGMPPSRASSASVSISGFAFSPFSLTREAPSTITWTNFDSVSHNVTSSGNFASSNLPQGGQFIATLSVPGTYEYMCTLHPWMSGQVMITNRPGVDLYVQSIAVTDILPDRKRITVTVMNIGTDTSSAFSAELGYVYKNDFHSLSMQAIDPLTSNQSQSFTYDWNILGKVGTFTIRAIAHITDVDGANNSREVATTILVPMAGIDANDP